MDAITSMLSSALFGGEQAPRPAWADRRLANEPSFQATEARVAPGVAVELYSQSAARWFVGVVCSADGEVCVVRFDQGGEWREKSYRVADVEKTLDYEEAPTHMLQQHQWADLAPVGTFCAEAPPGFESQPSTSRPGAVSYVSKSTGIRYRTRALAWAHFLCGLGLLDDAAGGVEPSRGSFAAPAEQRAPYEGTPSYSSPYRPPPAPSSGLRPAAPRVPAMGTQPPAAWDGGTGAFRSESESAGASRFPTSGAAPTGAAAAGGAPEHAPATGGLPSFAAPRMGPTGAGRSTGLPDFGPPMSAQEAYARANRLPGHNARPAHAAPNANDAAAAGERLLAVRASAERGPAAQAFHSYHGGKPPQQPLPAFEFGKGRGGSVPAAQMPQFQSDHPGGTIPAGAYTGPERLEAGDPL